MRGAPAMPSARAGCRAARRPPAPTPRSGRGGRARARAWSGAGEGAEEEGERGGGGEQQRQQRAHGGTVHPAHQSWMHNSLRARLKQLGLASQYWYSDQAGATRAGGKRDDRKPPLPPAGGRRTDAERCADSRRLDQWHEGQW